jgi:hypothetical protein
MSELGRFQEDINIWRRALAATSGDNLYSVYCSAAEDFGKLVNSGLDKQTAIDMLQDIAVAYHVSDDADEIEQIIAESFEKAPKPQPQQKTNGHAQQARAQPQPQQIIGPRPYVFPDPATIPPRQWLYATHYIRGFCVATVAPGGFGKSTLALNEALNMVLAGQRVWVISGEDDVSELDRRIAAHCKQHEFFPADFGDRLFLDDKLTFPFKIAKSSRNGPEFNKKRLEAFELAIKQNAIDVVILDPFVSFHLLAENDTGAMDLLIKTLADICSRTSSCIELAHHVRKPSIGQNEITVYDARGAAAIVNAVRSCRVLNQMSLAEAQLLQKPPEKRSSYFRIDSGKRNMAPPEKARWMHLVSVQIANGDFVAALEPFEFKPEEATEADEAWIVGVLSGGVDYRCDSRSPDWLGVKIAEHFDRSVNVKGDIVWINKQLKRWLTPDPPRRKKALIRKVVKMDDDSKERMFFELVESLKSA